MSRFQEPWLRLREPYDHAARSRLLAARFAAAAGPAPRLIDLGCGTGSNLRYLAPHLPGGQRWLLVDQDKALLDAARIARHSPTALRHPIALPARSAGQQSGVDLDVAFQALNLAETLPEPAGWTGITAAALLDLASAAWLDRLAEWCAGRPLLMALNVDGRLAWQPSAAGDETVRARFFADQRTDKGFGPALGPDAARHLSRRLEARGQRVFLESSDWRLGPADGALISATLDGILAVQDARVEPWAALRRRQLAAGQLRLTLGHVDLLALPA